MSNEALRRAAQAADHAIQELQKVTPFFEVGARGATNEEISLHGIAILAALTDAVAETKAGVHAAGRQARVRGEERADAQETLDEIYGTMLD